MKDLSDLGQSPEHHFSVNKTEIVKLNKEASVLLKEKKFKEAIDIYTNILKMPHISSGDQGVIFSNRSDAYLMLLDDTYNEKAKSDAEIAIQLFPSWWKGYFCLGVLQKRENDLQNAVKSFEKAFVLNQNSAEVFVEYTNILHKIGVLSRFEHFYLTDETQNDEDELVNIYHKVAVTDEHLKDKEDKESTNENSFAERQHMKGLTYYDGQGVAKNFRKAAEWFEEAAKNEYAPAIYNMGLIYKYGQGVERSLNKAFEYFKQAAEKGNTHGMLNLAYCYFLSDGCEDVIPTPSYIAEGMRWLQCAADKGDLIAKKELEIRENSDYMKIVLEAARNHASPQRIPESDQLDKDQFYKEINKAAKKGSLTAERMLRIWEYMDNATAALKHSDKKGVINALANAIRLDPDTVYIKPIWKPIIEVCMKANPHDLDDLTCFIHMNPTEEIISDSLKKFPQDEYLLHAQITDYIFAQRKQEALEAAKNALELYPNSLHFLYLHTLALSLNIKPELVKAANVFLAAAPNDHEYVPTCHYLKADYYFKTQNIIFFFSEFEEGLEKEKQQLPCFLPYQFPSKDLMEKHYILAKRNLEEYFR